MGNTKRIMMVVITAILQYLIFSIRVYLVNELWVREFDVSFGFYLYPHEYLLKTGRVAFLLVYCFINLVRYVLPLFSNIRTQ